MHLNNVKHKDASIGIMTFSILTLSMKPIGIVTLNTMILKIKKIVINSLSRETF